jgi:uncharacterized protein YcfL
MKRSIAFAVAALVVAGCSSDAASPVLTSDSVATTVPETTTSTSVPPSTSTSTTIAATTTLPPETTTTVSATPEDLIKEAVQTYAAAYHTCGLSPATCDSATFTALEGRSRQTIAELATAMSKQGLYFSTDTRGSHVSAKDVSLVSPTQAAVMLCWYDAGIVLGPPGPDGLPTVVNDESGTSLYSLTLFLEDGTWRVAEQSQPVPVAPGDQCASA